MPHAQDRRAWNFRGFEKLELALAPVSVIVGPSSSGKTTVLHAISAAHRAYAQSLDAPEAHPVVKGGLIQVCDGVILQDHARLLPIANQEEIFRDGDVAEGVATELDLTFEDTDPVRRLVVRLSYMRNQVLKLAVEVDCPEALAVVKQIKQQSKHRSVRLLEAVRRDLPVSVLVPAFYGVTLKEEFRTAPVVDEQLQEGQQSRIVADRLAGLVDASLQLARPPPPSLALVGVHHVVAETVDMLRSDPSIGSIEEDLMAMRGLISERLKEANVPVLNLEVDCVDSRNVAEGQVHTRLEAFLEMLS